MSMCGIKDSAALWLSANKTSQAAIKWQDEKSGVNPGRVNVQESSYWIIERRNERLRLEADQNSIPLEESA